MIAAAAAQTTPVVPKLPGTPGIVAADLFSSLLGGLQASAAAAPAEAQTSAGLEHTPLQAEREAPSSASENAAPAATRVADARPGFSLTLEDEDGSTEARIGQANNGLAGVVPPVVLAPVVLAPVVLSPVVLSGMAAVPLNADAASKEPMLDDDTAGDGPITAAHMPKSPPRSQPRSPVSALTVASQALATPTAGQTCLADEPPSGSAPLTSRTGPTAIRAGDPAILSEGAPKVEGDAMLAPVPQPETPLRAEREARSSASETLPLAARDLAHARSGFSLTLDEENCSPEAEHAPVPVDQIAQLSIAGASPVTLGSREAIPDKASAGIPGAARPRRQRVGGEVAVGEQGLPSRSEATAVRVEPALPTLDSARPVSTLAPVVVDVLLPEAPLVPIAAQREGVAPAPYTLPTAPPLPTAHAALGNALLAHRFEAALASGDTQRDWAAAFDAGGTARVETRTPTLGAITIEVARATDGLAVTLCAATGEARALLADAQPRLATDARAAGFALAQSRVDDAPQRESRGHGGRSPSRRPATNPITATSASLAASSAADRYA